MGDQICSPGSGTASNTLDFRDLSHEPVAAAGQSLNEPRTFRGIAQRLAQTIDGRVNAVVDVYKGVRRPKLLPKLLPGDDLAGMFQQKCKNLKRLLLELDLHPLLAQLAGLQVSLENTKAQHARCRR